MVSGSICAFRLTRELEKFSPALAERGVLRTQQFFEMLNAHLADRDFIATDRFSIADITYQSLCEVALEAVTIDLPKDRPETCVSIRLASAKKIA